MDPDILRLEEEISHIKDEILKLKDRLIYLQNERDNRISVSFSKLVLRRVQELESFNDYIDEDTNNDPDPRGTGQYAWDEEISTIASKIFLIDHVWPLQRQIINLSMKGTDTIVVMPTGAGKSLCYQLPSLLNSFERFWLCPGINSQSHGIVLVVSPLIALMRDQVNQLKSLGIKAEMFSSVCSKEEMNATRQEIKRMCAEAETQYNQNNPSKEKETEPEVSKKRKKPQSFELSNNSKSKTRKVLECDDVEILSISECQTEVEESDFEWLINDSDSVSSTKFLSNTKILFITPERLTKSKQTLSTLESIYHAGLLSLIAIDEAHCVSQWGHSFRPDYQSLRMLRIQFPSVPIMALTATATPHVCDDIATSLQMGCKVGDSNSVPSPWDGRRDRVRVPYQIVRSSSNRKNIRYRVIQKPTSDDEFATMLKNLLAAIDSSPSFANNSYKLPFFGCGTALVYCTTRKQTETIAEALRGVGLTASAYHAVLEDSERSIIQDLWGPPPQMGKEKGTAYSLGSFSGRLRIIVATSAFGMGINRPDVRLVVHHSSPRSIESFYQESGRAGRDGLPALSVVCSEADDVGKQAGMVAFEASGIILLRRALQLLWGVSCIRIGLGKYFEDAEGREFGCEEGKEEKCFACYRGDKKEEEDVGNADEFILSVLLEMLVHRTNCGGGLTKKDKNLTILQMANEWRMEMKSKSNTSQLYLSLSKEKQKGIANSIFKPKIGNVILEEILSRLFVLKYIDFEINHTAYMTHVYVVLGRRRWTDTNLMAKELRRSFVQKLLSTEQLINELKQH